MVLGPEGFHVMSAFDDVEAWQKIAEQMPDLILVDEGFCSGGGFLFCEQLKRNEPTRGVPVILLTPPEGTSRSPDLFGAVDSLAKPFESQDLIDAVNSALDYSHARRTCPICDDDVESEAFPCPDCGALHHPECWQLNDGCGTCGYRDPSADSDQSAI